MKTAGEVQPCADFTRVQAESLYASGKAQGVTEVENRETSLWCKHTYSLTHTLLQTHSTHRYTQTSLL